MAAFRTAFRSILVAGLLGLLSLPAMSCATASPSSGSRVNQDVITSEELRELGRLTAFQAIQRLHPQWLQPRGVDSINNSNEVVVYIDGARVGGVGYLRRVNSQNVERIEWLNSRAATTQYGVGHPSGALLVTTRRR